MVTLRPHFVRLGEYIKGTTIDCQGKLCNEDGAQNIEVKKVIPHPEYRPAPDWKNDICLLGLRKPVRITRKRILHNHYFISIGIYWQLS